MYLVFVLYALFASVFTVSKTALEFSQPFFLIGTRMLLAGILMLGYEFFFNREGFKMTKSAWIRIGLLGFLNIYVTNACEFYGLQHLTSFKTCFIYSLSPFLSAVFSYFLLKEIMTNKKWLGLAVGCLGMLPVLLSGSSGEELSGQFFFLSGAEIAVMVAAACSVYGWILLKQLISENKLSSFMANGLSMFLGGALALGHSYAVEDWNPIPVTSFVPYFECTLTLLIVSNILAYNLYGHLLKSYTATFISFAGFTTPVFTAIFGWLFLGEVVTLPFYLSAIIVTYGLFLFHQEELKKGYRVLKPEKAT